LNTEGKGTLISEKLAKEWGIVPSSAPQSL
jgi:hypothetical protein